MPLKWESPKCQEKGIKKSTQCSFSRLQEKIFAGLLQPIQISQYSKETWFREQLTHFPQILVHKTVENF